MIEVCTLSDTEQERADTDAVRREVARREPAQRRPDGDGSATRSAGRLPGKTKSAPGDGRGAPPVWATAYGRAVLSSSLDRIETAPKGFRHDSVFAAAAQVGNYVAGGEIRSEEGAAAQLEAMARTIGLQPAEAERHVARGLALGMTTPKSAPSGRMILDRAEAINKITQWWEAVEAHPFDGRAGATTRRILAGIATLAVGAGKLRINESYRQIAEAAGVTAGTVAKHRDRIAPWVRVVRRGSPITGKATTWQLLYKRTPLHHGNNLEGYPSRIPGMFPKRNTATDPGHDAWQRWPNGWRMYTHLDVYGPTTATALTAALGLHKSTVSRGLRRLENMGLATRHGDGWLRKDAPSAGQTLRRRQRMHQQERDLWRLWRHATVRRDREETARRPRRYIVRDWRSAGVSVVPSSSSPPPRDRGGD